MSVDVPRLLDALGIEARHDGDELWAPCPYPDHTETRPSWSIRNTPFDQGHGQHYCFGCHSGGGAIDLVMAVVGVSYSYAKQWITDHKLWIEGEVPLEIDLVVVKQTRFDLCIPKGLRGGPLSKWVTPVRRYVEDRGITAQQVVRWDLKYAVHGSMRGRVVFPVADETNTWLGWHARSYSGQEKRYKNASEADGYDSGAIFGMRWWPWPQARSIMSLVLTEGAIDALACERAGAQYVGAIGGSEPTARQILKLSGWKRVLVATDGDHAGDNVFAILRHALTKTDVRRVAIPSGLDAAELAKTSIETLKDLLKSA